MVFTGGVGENSAAVRNETAAGIRFLGVHIDDRANGSATPDVDITAQGADVRTLVVEAREDVQIAGEVRRLLRDVSGSARPQSRPG